MNIVLSGASSGIGYELAIKLAAQNHQVLTLARSEEKLEQLKKRSPTIQTLAIDLKSPALKVSIAERCESWESIDVLINNAGQLVNKSFDQSTPEVFLSQYESNVLTAVNLIQACMPFFTRGTHVVNISSMGGFQGSSKFPGLAAYSSSKGALSVLTECLAEEYKDKGWSFNALALGAVQTKMLELAFPDYRAPLTPVEMATYIANFSLTANQFYNGKVLPVALGNP